MTHLRLHKYHGISQGGQDRILRVPSGPEQFFGSPPSGSGSVHSGYAPKNSVLDNIDIIIDFFMIVSDFFEQSVIFRPIALFGSRCVVFQISCFPSLGHALSLSLTATHPPSLLLDTVPCSCNGLEQPRLLSNARLSPVSYSYHHKRCLSSL